jgi:type II secretory pathway pseudopilin PulG
MLVTIVAGIVAAIAMPRFAGAIARTRLERAVHRLVEDIELTRRAARAASTTQTLYFDARNASYSVDGLLARDLSAEPFSARMPTAAFEGNSYLAFDGYGMPMSSGLITIRAGDFVQVLSISADTGEVSLGAVTVTHDVYVEPAPTDPIVLEEQSPSIKLNASLLALPDSGSVDGGVQVGDAIPLN